MCHFTLRLEGVVPWGRLCVRLYFQECRSFVFYGMMCLKRISSCRCMTWNIYTSKNTLSENTFSTRYALNFCAAKTRSIHIHTPQNVFLTKCIDISMHLCIYLICIYMNIYIYIHIYLQQIICIYMYIYIYIYIYTCSKSCCCAAMINSECIL